MLYLVLVAGTASVWLAGDRAWAGAAWIMGRSASHTGPGARVATVAITLILVVTSWRVSSAAAEVVPQPHRAVTNEQVTEVDAGSALTFMAMLDPAGPVSRTYTVRSGDCLWSIARATILEGGDRPTGATIAALWQQIYQINTDVIGANPRLIFPGQILVLPGR